MESEIAFEFLPFVRLYKDGRIERLMGNDIIPASLDPTNDFVTKEVIYSPEHNLSVRLFLPHKSTQLAAGNKLPLLIYFHGGVWIISSPFDPVYHNFLTEVVKSADCLAASVQGRRAPKDPVPVAYEDAWSAIQWIFSHSNGSGREDWINKYADFDGVYVAGDSAGGNIAHHMTMRAGKEKLKPRIKGTVIVHPTFWGKDPVDEHDVQDREIRSPIAQVWEKIVSPNSVDGVNDLWFNVVGSGSDFSGMGCEKVLVAVAGKDVFLRQGLAYAAKLKKSWWQRTVKVTEEEAEDHNFHLLNPSSENTSKFIKKFVEFMTG